LGVAAVRFAFSSLTVVALTLTSLAGCADAKPSAAVQKGGCDQKTKSGLGWATLKKGSGVKPGAKDTVVVAYKGTLKDGKVFDQNDEASFPVAGVVPGFGEGLQLMEKGGQYRLCIPAALGYGAASPGPDIPANSDLTFEVTLKDVEVDGPLAAADRVCQQKLASGLGITTLKPGQGNKPTKADVVLVKYRGYLSATGEKFDGNDQAPIPVDRVIPGFSEGLQQMQRGGSYRLCIPAAIGYGAKEMGPIPANSDLTFKVDLIDFKSMAELEAAQKQQEAMMKAQMDAAAKGTPKEQAEPKK
jgi:FKBP-type peptidyl-prolyl cis-trans isomerase FkpA